MFELLIEGIESLRLPCSWVLVGPAIAVALAAGRHFPWVVGTFFTIATGVAWLRFGGNWFSVPEAGGQVALGLVILILAVAAWWYERVETSIASAGAVAVASAWLWIPCVGDDLAVVINSARDDSLGQLPGTIAFFVGLLIPVLFYAALGYADPNVGRRWASRRTALVGFVLIAIVGGLITATWFDDVASELARRSSF